MKLIKIMKLTPLRNETGKIYKWEEQARSISPYKVAQVRFEPAVSHVVVRLDNGEEIIIEDNLTAFEAKFEDATE